MYTIRNISKPRPSTYNLFVAFKRRIFPAKYIGTTSVLPACCLHITYIHLCICFHLHTISCVSIYKSLICNPTNTYYIIFPCRYMPLCNLLYTTHSVPIYHLCPIHLRLTSCISPAIPPPPTPHGRGQPHTLLRYLILLMHMYMYHVCVY